MTKALKPISIYIALFAVLVYYYYDQIQQLLIYLGYFTMALFAVLFLFAIIFGGWWLSEKIRIIRAGRIEAEKNAHVLIVQESGQIFIRDTDHNATWRAAHLQRSLYSNGHYEQPSLEEQRAWEVFISSKARLNNSNDRLLLEGEVMQSPVNLMNELQREQRCLIVGASNAGKTTLLKHIVNMRLPVSQVIVIDPHSSPDKWAGCQVVGTGRNYDQIEYTLDSLIETMNERYREIGRGEISEGSHDKITVIVDEWRAIVKNTNKEAGLNIGALLTEGRKASIAMYVASHSERIKALGFEGEGDLKDGFVMVRLSWENGERVSTIDRGEGQVPATLPGEFIRFDQLNSLSEKVFSIPNGPKPSEVELQILELADQDMSVSAIAREVYGHKSGNYNAKVKEVLAKFE